MQSFLLLCEDPLTLEPSSYSGSQRRIIILFLAIAVSDPYSHYFRNLRQGELAIPSLTLLVFWSFSKI